MTNLQKLSKIKENWKIVKSSTTKSGRMCNILVSRPECFYNENIKKNVVAYEVRGNSITDLFSKIEGSAGHGGRFIYQQDLDYQ